LLVAAARLVGLDEVGVWIGALRILVEVLHRRVRGRRVDVEVVLLDVLAVVALAVGEAEQALLQDRIDAVPQREREAQALLVVAGPGDAVLAPAIGARARVVVREVVPGAAGVAVVLADGAPLALAQIRPPAPPRDAGLGFLQALLLGAVHRWSHLQRW